MDMSSDALYPLSRLYLPCCRSRGTVVVISVSCMAAQRWISHCRKKKQTKNRSYLTQPSWSDLLLNAKSDFKSEAENRTSETGRLKRKMPDGFRRGSVWYQEEPRGVWNTHRTAGYRTAVLLCTDVGSGTLLGFISTDPVISVMHWHFTIIRVFLSWACFMSQS